jgi:hypothetical protein
VNRAAAATLAALLATGASARAADAPKAQVSGTVLTAEIAADPFAGGTGAGSLVIVDKAGQTSEYSVLGTTRVTRDGKKIKFDATLVGDLVVRAKYDPKSKTLTVLDLKSSGVIKAAAKTAAPAPVRGEVAFADAIKGELSVRTGKGATREFSVGETTKVLRETAGKPPLEVGFETVAVGDAVEVFSRDGKTADQIRVRPASR